MRRAGGVSVSELVAAAIIRGTRMAVNGDISPFRQAIPVAGASDTGQQSMAVSSMIGEDVPRCEGTARRESAGRLGEGVFR